MAQKKQKTIKLPIIISLTISIAIIIVIFYFTIDANTIKQLMTTRIKYEFFAVAILLNILYWFLWGARLKVLSNAMDKHLNIGLWKSTKIVIANMFLASITPSMAGGEPVRIHLLNKEGMA
ncbi:MAG: flippase-like domain-containing protein, partial [Thermoplasmatales archaeon]|nr:flippase-like domain-containing protein [Thermoplasmatales archaeon]